MKYYLLLIFMFLTFSCLADNSNKDVWIAVEKNVVNVIKKNRHPFIPFKDIIETNNENYYLSSIKDVDQFAGHLHHLLKRCGGFRVLDKKPTFTKNKNFHNTEFSEFWPNELDKLIDLNYTIDHIDLVNNMFNFISPIHIDDIIKHLSSYHTRYYKSKEGVDALYWIGKKWKELTNYRNDIKVEYFQHKNHQQPSVVLTIEGSVPSLKDQIIVLGGHGDSINSDAPDNNLSAPGANDNAAGIAVISDIIKILVENNYRPKHSLQFIAYAAEEVGLQGSQELVEFYREHKKRVIGVMQLDGINYSGKSYEMALISDLTHKDQNLFTANLIDTYLKVNWTWDKCGYACSDHYSWHSQGYRTSFPVEAIMNEQNPFIHTSEDTFDKSFSNSNHAQMFEKLAIAYLLELDN